MKTKTILILLGCILLAAFWLGATNTVVITKADGDAGSVRLVGMLITTEPLDEISSNTRTGTGSQTRFYADLVDVSEPDEETGEVIHAKEYVFSGIDGIRFFTAHIEDTAGSYETGCIDDAVADVIHAPNALSGTLYVTARDEGVVVRCNPVYQTSGGKVYAMPADYLDSVYESAGEPGRSWNIQWGETQTRTDGGTESSDDVSVEVQIVVVDEPIRTTVTQFDSRHKVLAQADYAPGTLPDTLNALPDTQYILTESVSEQGVTRTLFSPEDESLYAFYGGADGLCRKQTCAVRRSEKGSAN